MTFARAWVSRHAFLTAWAALALIIGILFSVVGQDAASAAVFGVVLGLAIRVAPYAFDPIPTPLSRDHWLMRAPVLNRLARLRHWTNPFYVEVITLRSPYRPTYCSSELKAAVIPFPWLPIKPPNIAGRVAGNRFVLKRMTFWADGGRPTGAGELVDAPPGTRIDLHVAAPAAGVVVLLFFTLVAIAIVALASAAALSARSVTTVVLIIGAVAFFVLVTFAIVASPLSPKVPFLGQPAESDRYVTFLSDVLGADVISRE